MRFKGLWMWRRCCRCEYFATCCWTSGIVITSRTMFTGNSLRKKKSAQRATEVWRKIPCGCQGSEVRLVGDHRKATTGDSWGLNTTPPPCMSETFKSHVENRGKTLDVLGGKTPNWWQGSEVRMGRLVGDCGKETESQIVPRNFCSGAASRNSQHVRPWRNRMWDLFFWGDLGEGLAGSVRGVFARGRG